MSLINDVLRDLEKRSRTSGAAAAVRAEPVHTGRRPAWLWIALVATGAAAIAYVWPGPPLRPSALLEEPASAGAIDSRIQLQTVSVSRDDRRVEMLLGLDGPVEHRAERADEGREVTLYLPGVAASVSLPAIGGLVENAALRQGGDGLVLQLTLAEPTDVRTVLDDGPRGAQLRLLLSAEPLTKRPAAAADQAAVQPKAEPVAEQVVAAKPPPVTPVVEQPRAEEPAASPAHAPEPSPEFRKQHIPPTPAELAARAYDRGMQAQQAGQLAEAEEAFREALLNQPGYVSGVQALAQLLSAQHRPVEAEQVLRDGLAATGQVPALVQQLARLLLAQGQHDAAVGVLEAGLPAAASDAEYLALLAAGYQRQGRFAAAADVYGAALRLRPGHGPWRIGGAIALESAGSRSAAIEAYRTALQGELAPELREYAQHRVQILAGVNGGSE